MCRLRTHFLVISWEQAQCVVGTLKGTFQEESRVEDNAESCLVVTSPGFRGT